LRQILVMSSASFFFFDPAMRSLYHNAGGTKTSGRQASAQGGGWDGANIR
jgi:hypothetical protein